MVTVVLSQFRHRVGRTLALLLGILVATTAFTVLTGAGETGRLQVTGVVEQNFRRSYDILVRPNGTRTPLEIEDGYVRSNFMSGIFGGITLKQYKKIRGLPGVDVAAPIAMVRYFFATTSPKLDITSALDSRPDQVLRVEITSVADRGLTRIPHPPEYAYVSPRPLTSITDYFGQESLTEDLPGGKTARIRGCETNPAEGAVVPDQFESVTSLASSCYSKADLRDWDPALITRSSWNPGWTVPMLVAAIDPDAEAKLSGLDRAVVAGRYLPSTELAVRKSDTGYDLPVLVADSAGIDIGFDITVRRLGGAAVLALRRGRKGDAILHSLHGPVAYFRHLGAQELFRAMDFAGPGSRGYSNTGLNTGWRTGPVKLDDFAGRLVPEGAGNLFELRSDHFSAESIPFENSDRQFRDLKGSVNEGVTVGLNRHLGSVYFPRQVGVFDPRRLHSAGDPAEEALLGWSPVSAAPADKRTATLLGGRDLLPSASIGGYLTQAPQLITTLDSIGIFKPVVGDEGIAKPVSAIRIRVAGVKGPDALSRERIRSVAEQIRRTTHLDVDIVIGSSPSPRTIVLPQGRFGRPELTLKENWLRKGVAVAVLTALDKKSLTLFVLILVVCALFVANAAGAAVRGRRTELGVLSCIGWPARRLFALLLGELAAVGLVAGAAGSLIALPLGWGLGLDVSPKRAAVAVPAAVILALLAGLTPAWRAARAVPADAVRPAVSTARRRGHPHTLFALAANNVLRVPARSLLGAASLAVGVAALTVLVAVTWSFRGAVVGSLLGDAVSLQIRTVDYVAVAATVLLGALAIADVLYLNVRERSAELAALQATGWADHHLAGLVVTEGILIGAAGAIVGGILGLAGAAAFARSLPTNLIAVTAAVAAGTILLAGVAALIPGALLRRLPTATLLAEE